MHILGFWIWFGNVSYDFCDCIYYQSPIYESHGRPVDRPIEEGVFMNKRTLYIVRQMLFYLFVIAFVGIIVLPFIWQFLTSIKPMTEISAIPAKWIPSEVNIQYYFNVFEKHPFAKYLLNSFIVALLTTVLSILIGASAAYALSRLRFRGKKFMLMAILSISMFPTIATLSPIYLLLKQFRLLNTYAGLIIPYITFALPLSIWLLTNFFSQLPRGFEEAAAIDGCSRAGIFFRMRRNAGGFQAGIRQGL